MHASRPKDKEENIYIYIYTTIKLKQHAHTKPYRVFFSAVIVVGTIVERGIPPLTYPLVMSGPSRRKVSYVVVV